MVSAELFMEIVPEVWFEVPESFSDAFKEVGEITLEMVKGNFDAGGRPQVWDPLVSGGASHLKQSGALYGSLAMDSGETFASVGPDAGIPYAAIHQFGGIINHPGSDKFQVFQSGGTTVYTHGTKPHPIRIPERPYLVWQDETVSQIGEILMGGIIKLYVPGKES